MEGDGLSGEGDEGGTGVRGPSDRAKIGGRYWRVLLRFSLSRVFALVAAAFLKRRQEQRMLRRLNAVYGVGMEPEKRMLCGLKNTFGRTVKERW